MRHRLKPVPGIALRVGAALHRAHSSECGYALLAVLWLIVTLSSLVGLSIAATRLGLETSANRIALAQGRWAAEACLAIVQARSRAQKFTDTATIDLGQGKRCARAVEDPTAKVNVNTTDVEILGALLDSQLVAVLQGRRPQPFQSVQELQDLATDARWIGLVTVDGPGTVNANAARAAVLLALPGLGAEAVERLVARREMGRPITRLDELSGTLSPGAPAVLLKRYADLARVLTFTAPQLVITARGWIDGRGGPDALHATIEVLVVPLPERLAAIRRRMW